MAVDQSAPQAFSKMGPYRRASADAGSFPPPSQLPYVSNDLSSAEPLPRAIGVVRSRGSSGSSLSTDASPSKLRRPDPSLIVKSAVRAVDKMREDVGSLRDIWSLTPAEFAELSPDQQEDIYSAEDVKLTNITRALVTVSIMGYLFLTASTGLVLGTGVRGVGSALFQMLFVFSLPCFGIPAVRNRNSVMLYLFSMLNVAAWAGLLCIWFKQSIICRKVYANLLPSPPFITPTSLVYLLTVFLVVLLFAAATLFLACLLSYRLARRVRYFNTLPPPVAPHMDELSASDEAHTPAETSSFEDDQYADFGNFRNGGSSVEFCQMGSESIADSERNAGERLPLPRQLPRQEDLDDSDLSDADSGSYESAAIGTQ
eukprot:GHVS01028600.1.p1 GENE.GHVS01028600.1~~GHVS01028600.1.p1  ORF type:complete len:371 (-),score=42.23 GHVS01028600.1:286-1398(-)